jgi:catechol 2,3-dioxygenase-like lactoylglutathione lyase family enzyme
LLRSGFSRSTQLVMMPPSAGKRVEDIMARGLDHIVHAVRDLDRAAELYRRMGFTVGARNRHPWGTHNHIVQCPGTFIELLTVAEPDKLGSDAISDLFGRYNQNYLTRGEGLSLLILESKDAKSDVDDFKRAGISAAEAVHFEREAKRPDGTPIKVGFSLAFAQDDAAPSIRFATCQQHYPENFWNPAFQNHPNGAKEIRSVIMVADEPERHRAFASAYTGSTDFYTEPGEVSVWTPPRGSLSIMTPVRFAVAFGGPQPTTGNHLQAIRFAVADIEAARSVMANGGVKTRNHREGFVIDPADALGATLSFEPVEKSRS